MESLGKRVVHGGVIDTVHACADNESEQLDDIKESVDAGGATIGTSSD